MYLIRTFIVGLKENFQFKWGLLGDIPSAIISLFLLATLWEIIFSTNYLPYLVIVYLIFPTNYLSLYNVIPYIYETNFLRKGWHYTLGKPADTFLSITSYVLGLFIYEILMKMIIGFLILIYLGLEIHWDIILISLPFVYIFEIALAYLISSISHHIHTTSGVRSIIQIIDNVSSGKLVPLYLIGINGLQLVSGLPFPNRTFYITDAILNGYIPIKAYINTITWSVLIIIIGYFLHRGKWNKFEALGG